MGEIGVDRIQLLDGRKCRCIVLHHERAFADLGGADDAVDRRADGRVVQVEIGARKVGLAAFDVGRGLPLRRDGLLVLDLGGRALARQETDPPRLLRSLHMDCFCHRQCCLARLHFHFERPRIDPVERIAGLDLAALTEHALDHDAGDARTNLGHTRRRDPPRQFAHHRARLRLDGHDADVRQGRLRSRRGLGRLIATGQQW